EAQDAARGTLVLGDRRRVDLDRLGWLELALQAVEPGRDQAAGGEVRVAARVRRLQLDVRRGLLRAPEERRHAYRRLAVVVPPARERAGPVLRDDAVVRVEARRGQAAEARQVLQHACGERARGRR